MPGPLAGHGRERHPVLEAEPLSQAAFRHAGHLGVPSGHGVAEPFVQHAPDAAPHDGQPHPGQRTQEGTTPNRAVVLTAQRPPLSLPLAIRRSAKANGCATRTESGAVFDPSTAHHSSACISHSHFARRTIRNGFGPW